MIGTLTPQSRIPGATRRIDPATLLPMLDRAGNPLWDMPAPIKYVEHTYWRRDSVTGKRVPRTVQVPVYRGTSAVMARGIKSQIRRKQRKSAEQARKDAAEALFKKPEKQA